MRGKPLVIAIDGPAAAGKGTLARRVAEALDFAHLDTGLLYRAIGFAVLRAGKNPMDEAAVLATVTGPDALHLDDPALRQDDVADAAAKVATLPGVRKRLLQFQRDFAAAPPGGKKGAVVEGRDIGTAVLPDANLKIFLTAALEIRAERRLKELRERGLQSIRSQLLREMRERDQRDQNRAVSPLRPAEDAVTLDTTELDADAAFEAAMTIIRSQKDFADKDRP